MEESEKTGVESRNENGWTFGRIYFNKEDKRIIIKRPRSGFGYIGSCFIMILCCKFCMK